MNNLICEVCNKKFNAKNPKTKCCSSVCNDERSITKRMLNKQTKKYLIFERDNFRCIYCGKSSIEDNVKLCVDHIYPISKNGKNNIFNLVTCCFDCNRYKHDTLLSDEVIIRLWSEIDKRNKQYDKNHFDELVKQLNTQR